MARLTGSRRKNKHANINDHHILKPSSNDNILKPFSKNIKHKKGPTLTPQILKIIFTYIIEDANGDDDSSDPSSKSSFTSSSLKDFRSCMLVNKLWCATAVPIFWSKPFHYHDGPELIRLYLLFLRQDKDSLNSAKTLKLMELLEMHGGNIEAESLELLLSLVKNENVTTRTFNYPALLKDLDYYSMLVSIRNWILNEYEKQVLKQYQEQEQLNASLDEFSFPPRPKKPIDHEKIFPPKPKPLPIHHENNVQTQKLIGIVVRELIELWISHNVRLDGLLIDTHSRDVYDIERDDEFMLIAQHEFRSFTSSLTRLNIAAGFNKGRLFGWLSRNCNEISHLTIDMVRMRSYKHQMGWDENGNLASLIEKQYNLKYLKLSGYDADNADMGMILPAVAEQSSTLQSLHFEEVDFTDCPPFDDIASCEKLESLRFVNVDNVWADMIKPLMNKDWENLKRVEAIGTSCTRLRVWADGFNDKPSSSVDAIDRL
ncbi:10649_t:CDS:2 [Ambispora leptoticha]|uniref:10649_t:CDS:1 n=1 Tax=Ambispora leptoticha TaxID=144679 RepID=A0A9N9AKK8_9GLOM|nr:10649_t:CDS:2 [Ambispora leptoticha]